MAGSCGKLGPGLSAGMELIGDVRLRRVKCFYAGVRWGLALPPEALASRHALAASLTAAFSQVWHVLMLHSPCCMLLGSTCGLTRPVATGPAAQGHPPDMHAVAAREWQGLTRSQMHAKG